MKIRNSIDSGEAAEQQLKNRISQLVRSDRTKNFKLGITGNPKRRRNWYLEDGDVYDEMVVVFQTSKESVIRRIEGELVDYYFDSENIAHGGGGPVKGPPYYLYIVRDLL